MPYRIPKTQVRAWEKRVYIFIMWARRLAPLIGVGGASACAIVTLVCLCGARPAPPCCMPSQNMYGPLWGGRFISNNSLLSSPRRGRRSYTPLRRHRLRPRPLTGSRSRLRSCGPRSARSSKGSYSPGSLRFLNGSASCNENVGCGAEMK